VFAQADRDVVGRGEIAAQSVDRQAEWLEVTIGAKLASFAAGITPRQLDRIAHGQEEPDSAVEERLRNVFAVATYLAMRDGGASAYTWLTEPNPELQGQTPAALLHNGKSPETVWLAAAPPF
jgi:hypothetical protein